MRNDVFSFFGQYLFKNGKMSKNRICLSSPKHDDISLSQGDLGEYGIIFSTLCHSQQAANERSIARLSHQVQMLSPYESLCILQLFDNSNRHQTIDDYASAARSAYEAGFDGVEIIDTHSSSLTHRVKIARDIIKACRYVVPKDFLLGFRMSPEDPQTGIDLDDSLQIAESLAQDGTDFIALSLSNVLLPSTKYLHLSKKPILAYFRERLGNHYPLLVAGSVRVPTDAQKALEIGASFIALTPQASYSLNAS